MVVLAGLGTNPNLTFPNLAAAIIEIDLIVHSSVSVAELHVDIPVLPGPHRFHVLG